jgi:hypothetical protein
MKETHESAAAREEGEEKADDDSSGDTRPQDNFEFTPEQGEREEIVLESDDGLGRLLKAAPQFDIDEEDNSGGAGASVNVEVAPTEENKPEEQAMESTPITQVDDREIEGLLAGLLKEDEPPMPPPPSRASKATRQRKSNSSVVSKLPPADPVSREVPLSILCAQIKLYVQHTGQQLESVCGPIGSTEQQKWLKTITPRMGREEIEGTLAAIKGTLVVTNGVNMVRSSVMVGMGLCETTAPYVGMLLGGLTSELANKKEELELIATQMVLDSYDAYAQK